MAFKQQPRIAKPPTTELAAIYLQSCLREAFVLRLIAAPLWVAAGALAIAYFNDIAIRYQGHQLTGWLAVAAFVLACTASEREAKTKRRANQLAGLTGTQFED